MEYCLRVNLNGVHVSQEGPALPGGGEKKWHQIICFGSRRFILDVYGMKK